MTKPRVRLIHLIHWHEAESVERRERLRALGYSVVADALRGSGLLRELRQAPPAAFVLDLGRLPSHGREVALSLRADKTLRRVPLVFVEGAPDKVERIRAQLPDVHAGLRFSRKA